MAVAERDFKALEKRRLRALALRRSGVKRSEVARVLGVARQTVMRWEKKADAGGEKAILWNGRNGRPSRMTAAQLEELRQAIIDGPDKNGFDTPIWTCRRVATLIRKRFSIRYHHDHVWRILRGLGFSVQKPARRARERDEAKIKNWRERRWPALKKKPEKNVVR